LQKVGGVQTSPDQCRKDFTMRIFLTGFLCFICALAYADGLDKVVLKSDQITAVANQVNSSKICGYVERIDLNFSQGTMPVDVVILSSNPLTQATTTLYTSDSVATNLTYYPGLNRHNTSGAVAFTNNATRYCLLDEVIYMTITNSVTNAQTTIATVIYEAK